MRNSADDISEKKRTRSQRVKKRLRLQGFIRVGRELIIWHSHISAFIVPSHSDLLSLPPTPLNVYTRILNAFIANQHASTAKIYLRRSEE